MTYKLKFISHFLKIEIIKDFKIIKNVGPLNNILIVALNK